MLWSVAIVMKVMVRLASHVLAVPLSSGFLYNRCREATGTLQDCCRAVVSNKGSTCTRYSRQQETDGDDAMAQREGAAR